MPNKPNPNNVVWDENLIEWDQPSPPEQQKQVQAGFDFDLALKNLSEGAWGKLKDLVNPETYINLTQFANTAGQDPIGTAKLIANDFIGKYGSWDKVKSTFQNTPIEPLLDASMLLTGGGTAAAKLPGWLGKIGKTAETVGMATDPFNIVTAPIKGVGWLMKGPVDRAAARFYSSSVNISKKLDIADMDRAIEAGLELGVVPNRKGLSELKGSMDRVRIKINEAIDTGTKNNDFVNTWSAVSEIDNMKSIYSNRMVHDPDLIRMLDDIQQGLVEMHGERIPVKKAQDIKMQTQQFLNKTYDRYSDYAKEAEKYATRGVRLELENLYPVLKELNPKMQEYTWLKEGIERTVKNRMSGPLLPGGGVIKGIISDTIDHPAVKSRLAILLKKAEKMNKISPMTTLGRESVYKGANIFQPKEQPQGMEE